MTKASILRQYNKIKYSKLAASVTLDVIGMSSYLLPVIGEAEDLVWAPISGLICFMLYRGKLGVLGGIGNGIEEMSPGGDIIPAATGIWAVQYRLREKRTLQEYLLRLNLKEEIIDAFVRDGTITVDAVEHEDVSVPMLKRFQRPTPKPAPEKTTLSETEVVGIVTAEMLPAISEALAKGTADEVQKRKRAPEPLDADEAELMKKYGA